MERRTLLRDAGVAGAVLLAGCLGGGREEFTMKVASQQIDQDEEGDLVLHVTISNPGNEKQTGTLYVTSKLNDEELVRVREVTLDAHQTTQVTIEYDVNYNNVTSFSPKTSIEPSSE